MGLKIMKDKDGRPRDTWYARFTRNGSKVNVSLGVPIRGTVPIATDADGRTVFDVNGRGDEAFEKSREAALVALEKMQKEAKTTGDEREVRDAKTAVIALRYYRARTGRSLKDQPLSKMGDIWKSRMRTYTPTPERTRAAMATFARFEKFVGRYCAEHGGRCSTIAEITPEIAGAFFKHIFGEYAWGTVKDQMSVLSGVYAHAMDLRTTKVNGQLKTPSTPFNSIIKRNRELGNRKVQREPLSEEQIARLYKVTEENPAIHDLVVAATCTGMRIGDVCRLKWDDVDLPGNIIDTETAKAGVRVPVPIFAPLRAVLEARRSKYAIGDSPYVFPRFAAQYDHVNAKGVPDQRTGIFRMVKPYFARAIFAEPQPTPAKLVDAKPKSLPEVLEAIDGAGFAPAKRERVREVITRFKRGERCKDIAAALGIARGQVSSYLKDVERLTGEIYRPQTERRSNAGRASARDLIDKTRMARKIGKHAASLYGWHNLRHTFVVQALAAGVPINDVTLIVGHKDTKTTLENYGNNSRKAVAERTRKQVEQKKSILATGSIVANGATIEAKVEVSSGEALAPAEVKPSVDDLIASMSEDQRKELARKLLGL